MAKKQTTKKATKKEEKPVEPVTTPEDEYPISPDFWDDLLETLPPWLDEILAIALLIFGVLSFITLLVPSEAVAAVAWSNIMTGLFGYGSLVVSVGLFSLGIIILLPKAGIQLSFAPYRILALEIAFLAILATLHLSNSDPELRAIARAGEGGGIIGWGLGLPSMMIGRDVTLAFYAIVLFISIAIVAGVRKSHLSKILQSSITTTDNLRDKLQDPPEFEQTLTPVSAQGQAVDIMALSKRRLPLMRIRVNPENIPSSAHAAPSSNSRSRHISTPESDDSEISNTITDTNHPLISGQRQLKLEFNAIGSRKFKQKGVQMVERPDGRVKRYFTVEGMKEAKKIGRREKSLPDLELLENQPLNIPDEDEINHNVVLIENTLLEFDIDVDVVDVQVGPTVTRYAVQPFKETRTGRSVERTRISKIAALSNDLALSLSAKRLRLEMPVPGQNYMGIEVPNKNPSVVDLRSVYESREFFDYSHGSRSPLVVPLGRDVSGQTINVDIGKMPHLLIAGTTGSGKSVCIAALTVALLLNNTPDKVKMVMLDPKMVELSRFNGLPHLIGPVETEVERIIEVLRWCTREMDRRYKLLEEHAARNIEIFNSRLGTRRRGGDYLPYIVILIDEIGDLMMSKPEETEKSVTRIAQMARAVGMHLVVATQRPSVDVITGLIKANFPTRMSFAVASGVDSRVILDTVGAETLLGKGDMLYLANDAGGPKRVQGCFVSDSEVRRVVEHWQDLHQEQIKAGKSEPIVRGPWERGLTRREFLAETDPMLEEAIELVVETGHASASMIQRRLGLGYPRAARIIDMLEELGVIGEPVGGGRTRRVLISPGQDAFKRIIDKKMRE